MPSDSTAPAAYDLTFFTGRKKNAERVFFIRNYEMNLFTTYVVGASAIASVPFSALACFIIALFSPGLSFLGISLTVLFVVAGLVFVDQRSRRGLKLRNYRALMDSRSTAEEKSTIYICGEPVRTPEVAFFTPQYVLETAGTPLASVATGIAAATGTNHEKVSLLDA